MDPREHTIFPSLYYSYAYKRLYNKQKSSLGASSLLYSVVAIKASSMQQAMKLFNQIDRTYCSGLCETALVGRKFLCPRHV